MKLFSRRPFPNPVFLMYALYPATVGIIGLSTGKLTLPGRGRLSERILASAEPVRFHAELRNLALLTTIALLLAFIRTNPVEDKLDIFWNRLNPNKKSGPQTRLTAKRTAIPSHSYAWCPLPAFHGKVAIPAGWHCRPIRVDRGEGYEITPKKLSPDSWDSSESIETSETVGATVRVYSGPSWTQAGTDAFAQKLTASLTEGKKVFDLKKDTQDGYTTAAFSTEGIYDVIPNKREGSSQGSNRDTPTPHKDNVLVTLRRTVLILNDPHHPVVILAIFNCPVPEWPNHVDACKTLFATLSLFEDKPVTP